ncbi:MAG: hypothetical protein ABTR07_11425 [Candidatus Competibacter denitrificans]
MTEQGSDGSTARQVAIDLANCFLADGRYVLAPAPGSGVRPASSSSFLCNLEDAGFSGLSVQSVGYEEGKQNPKVHIYVTRGSLGALRKLEQSIRGVPIKINNIGEIRVRPEAALSTTAHGNLYIHKGRIACGSSCAPSAETYSGTFGALAKDADGRLFILSNNHVLAACNHVPVGMPIMAPSNSDARPNKPAPLAIGSHHGIVELRSGEPTLVPCAEVDAAVALVIDDKKVTSWQGDAEGYDTPSAIIQPKAGMKVKKFGRTSGLTYGTVEAVIPGKMPLPYKTKNFSATVWFENVWTILGMNESFALPGDSGSLVVTDDGQHSVGLIFAASRDYGIIVPITEALLQLGTLSLVSGHGINP